MRETATAFEFDGTGSSISVGTPQEGSDEILGPINSLIRTLGLSEREVNATRQRETSEITRREHLYCNGRPLPVVIGRTVIVVDDGIATGFTLSAAIALLRHQRARRTIVAVPIAPSDTVNRLRGEADDVIALMEPHPFNSVSQWYEDFSQTSDGEVHALVTVISPVPESKNPNPESP